MNNVRTCSKPACTRQAIATLTFVYADSTAVLGQLSVYAEPHTYDLCKEHTNTLNVPKGWQVLKLDIPELNKTEESDMFALVDALKSEDPRAKIIHNEDKELLKHDVPQLKKATQKSHLRLITDRED
ncbi:MAG: DUF3499 domain-containing protein [Micrococcaceae bacterium]